MPGIGRGVMSLRTAEPWFFDMWAQGYDFALAQRLAYRPVHDAVLRALHEHGLRTGRVLDVGCGTGELACRLARVLPRVRVIGCDFSAGMLRRAAAKGGAARWVRGDACRLPLRDRSVDVVVSTEAFHWSPDQDRALREFRRVLVPGGRLLLALVTPPLSLVSSVAHLGSRLVGQPFYWPTRAEIRAQLERAGFRVDVQRRVFRLPGLFILPLLTAAVSPRTGPRATKRRNRQHEAVK
jgi:SAM-dependent methyltransferase